MDRDETICSHCFWGLMMKEIKNHMKFLDLFAGIGGFRLGMESAGHECIGFAK